MLLTPAERDRLLVFTAAELARARRARGLRLNVPETIALVADAVCEAARDGARHAEALDAGRRVLGPGDVLPGVADVVREVKVEAVFEDGTRMVVVTDPVGPAPADGLGVGGREAAPEPVAREADAVVLTVTNSATVPISVSSHFHFFEVNPRLAFDRARAYGRHLRIAAGSTRRFDPGVPTEVSLVPFGGERVVVGFSGLVDGALDGPGAREAALERARATGFLDHDPVNGPGAAP
ncbi:MAG TPA: urease subunit gamma [Actinomycetes bacterium]|nr:urease subunit gamma [Actinomycetes bacterium]